MMILNLAPTTIAQVRMASTVEEKKERRHPIHDLALAATKQVWMALAVEEKKKQGCQNLHTCSSSNWASMNGTGNGKPKPSHAWHTTLDENPSVVAPKIWCDLHLIQILAEGRRDSFLVLSRGRNILSLCLPCPDWAILNLGDTQGFWRGFGSLTFTLNMTISLSKP